MDYGFDQVIDRHGTASLKWARYAGRDVLALWVADMDFRSPPAVLKALEDQVRHGVFGYGIAPAALIQTVVERMERLHGWVVHPDWIVWLPGLVVGLNIACRSIGREGDQVIAFTPVYPPILSAPKSSGKNTLRVPLVFDGASHRVDLERFESSITDRTRLLLWCNPHNPVGRCFTRQEVEQVARICLKHGVIICSDEIHGDLILDPNARHVACAAIDPEVARHTITLMAPSKTFNIPGLGCSLAIIPDAGLRRAFCQARCGLVPHVNVMGFAAALAAYRDCEDWRGALITYLRANCDWLRTRICGMPGLSMGPVEATYLAWIDARGLGTDDPWKLFEDAGVGLSDGKDFDGPGFVRLNFGCPRAILEQAITRMAQVCCPSRNRPFPSNG